MKLTEISENYMNDHLAAVTRQNELMRGHDLCSTAREEFNRMDEIKRAAGLISPAREELNRLDEINRSLGMTGNMQSILNVTNLVPDFGISSTVIADMKRVDDMQRSVAGPPGITGMVQENMDRINDIQRSISFPAGVKDLLHVDMSHLQALKQISIPFEAAKFIQDGMAYKERNPGWQNVLPEYNPVDVSLFQVPANPMHKVAKILEKNERRHEEVAGHLLELVMLQKGTGEQNDKMITLSKKNLLIAVLGVVITVIIGFITFYYAGKNSVPSPPPAPTLNAAPAPVVQSIISPAPITKNK